jgi:hypothetical protein
MSQMAASISSGGMMMADTIPAVKYLMLLVQFLSVQVGEGFSE